MQKPIVIFITNYPENHVISERARIFSKSISDIAIIKVLYRERNIGRIKSFWSRLYILNKNPPNLIFTFDGFISTELPTFIASIFYKVPYICDTACDIYDEYKIKDKRLIKFLSYKIFHLILRRAKVITCRGLIQKIVFESRYLNKNIIHVSEGVIYDKWQENSMIKKDELFNNVENPLIIGVIGSIVWDENLGWAYGLEVIEVLKRLRFKNICGLVLPSPTSSGAAIKMLNEIALKYDLQNKFKIIDNVHRDILPNYLATIDICISTQIPNIIGEMRTTAKLPEYMAAGRYILATKVGDARFYLHKDMLIEYESSGKYYDELSKRVDCIEKNREKLLDGRLNKAKAKSNFSYEYLIPIVREEIEKILFQSKL